MAPQLVMLVAFLNQSSRQFFCLVLALLYTSLKLRFVQSKNNPPTAHNLARLRVAAGCADLFDFLAFGRAVSLCFFD